MGYQSINKNEIHLRIGRDDYISLSKIAEKKGYSKAELCRKIIHEYITSDEANSSLNVMNLAMKESLKVLDSKFFDIKDFNYKIYRSNLINKFLIFSLLEQLANMNPLDIKRLHDDANKKAFYYMSQRLNDEDDIIDEEMEKDLDYMSAIFSNGGLDE